MTKKECRMLRLINRFNSRNERVIVGAYKYFYPDTKKNRTEILEYVQTLQQRGQRKKLLVPGQGRNIAKALELSYLGLRVMRMRRVAED